MARPLKKAATDTGGTVTIGLRVDAELRTALEAAADEMDRNLSQECERRLRRSFEPAEMLQDAVDGMLQQGGLLRQPQETHDFIDRAIGLLCGRDAAELAAALASVLGFINIRDMHRRKPGGQGYLANAEIPFRKADLDALKAALRKIEQQCTIVKEEK